MKRNDYVMVFRVPKALVAKLREVSKIEDRTVASILRLAIILYLDTRKANQS